MRPQTLEEVVGQEKWTEKGRLLHQALSVGKVPSLIFWGPPGCGKTTLARVMAQQSGYRFEALSAVFSGVKELRQVVARAQDARTATLLFVDEIHRFNKSQQDAFLPFVEDGTLTLIGATTENPSFELNNALLSRCRVVVLQPLTPEHVAILLERALHDDKRGYGGQGISIEKEVVQAISQQAAGDARYGLNVLETLLALSKAAIDAGTPLGLEQLSTALDQRAALYDRAGEEHYNLISALHKSLRGSDVDAALYWLARMLAGGEDGLYIARRLVRFASEDVGNADPQALAVTLQARDSFHFLGSPEGDLALAQAVVYLATAPKSNSVYMAFKAVQKVAKKTGNLPPPAHILNAPTQLMKSLGYGKNYRYAHDYEGGYVAQEYLPDALAGSQFYQPVARGFEREIQRRMAWWKKMKQQQEEEDQ
ncbi:MAG: replication-associated recombination protein A [Magnetococcales bacterium]|nr:replication-associated recombination protein A [Magnetococcales bacterium]